MQIVPQQTGSERPVEAAAPANTQQQKTDERPSWLPAKFKSVEQLAEAYTHLESKLGAPKEPATADAKPADGDKPKEEAKPEDKKPEDKSLSDKLMEEGDKPQDKPEDKPEDKKPEDKKEDEVVKTLKDKGVDVDAMSERFWKTGEVDTKDRELLVPELDKLFGEGKGEKMLETFATNQKLAAAYVETKLYEPLGGKEQGEAMVEWATKNLSVEQRKAIKTLWDGDTLDSQVEGSRLLKTLYEAKNGKQPTVVLNGDVPSVSADAYQSMEQVTQDMGDKRYKDDPAFRAQVQAKLARSKL
jgi:hypothetical protein